MKKNQALFSSKDKSKILKCRLLQFLFGTLRVNIWLQMLIIPEVYNVFQENGNRNCQYDSGHVERK